MHYTCPKCQSDQIAAHDYAKKVGGLIGGASGCMAGAALGEAVDEHILNNFHCLGCGFQFNC